MVVELVELGSNSSSMLISFRVFFNVADCSRRRQVLLRYLWIHDVLVAEVAQGSSLSTLELWTHYLTMGLCQGLVCAWETNRVTNALFPESLSSSSLLCPGMVEVGVT